MNVIPLRPAGEPIAKASKVSGLRQCGVCTLRASLKPVEAREVDTLLLARDRNGWSVPASAISKGIEDTYGVYVSTSTVKESRSGYYRCCRDKAANAAAPQAA